MAELKKNSPTDDLLPDPSTKMSPEAENELMLLKQKIQITRLDMMGILNDMESRIDKLLPFRPTPYVVVGDKKEYWKKVVDGWD